MRVNMKESTEETAELDQSKNPYQAAVTPLKNGLLKIYEPSLIQVEKALTELTVKESSLFDQIHNENLALAETQHSSQLAEMFGNIETYQTKLMNIKKDMKHLHDKSVKLKKRALKIQQLREKQEYIKQQKEAEIKMEQDLIGKPTSTNS